MRTTHAWTRPLALYLVMVVLPTAALVGLSLDSLRREVLAVRNLTEANRQLLAEQLGTELEREVTIQADRCLRAANLSNLPATLAGCPIASEFFLLDNGMLRYPSHAGGTAARFIDDLRFAPRLALGTIYPLAYAQGEPAKFFYMQPAGSPPHRLLAVRLNLN